MDAAKKLLAFFIYIVLPFFFGCAGNEPTAPQMYTVRIEGKVFNSVSFDDILLQNKAVSNARVNVYRIDGNGITKVNANFAVTDSYGKFLIETEFEGNREYLVVAQKDEKVWKAVINAAVENEVTIFIQPLTDESTAEAEVYLAAGKKYNIPYYDISLLVTGETSALILNNQGYAEIAANIINSALQARSAAFGNEYFGVNSELYAMFIKTSEDTRTKYARDLHFAQTASTIKALTADYYSSYINTFLSAGLNNDEALKAFEIYFRVLVNPLYDNHEMKKALRKSASLLKAALMTNSFSSDIQNLNGGRKVREVRYAGETLLNSISSSNDYGNIQTYFSDYQEVVLDNLFRISGMSSALKNSIEQKINPDLIKLSTSVELTSEPNVIVDSYISYYSSTSAEVNSLLKNTYNEDSECITEMMIMLYIDF